MRLGAGDFALRRALQPRHVDFLGPPKRPSCKRRAPVVDHSAFPTLGSERLIWPFGIWRFGRTKPIFSIPFRELRFRHRCRACASPRSSTSAARSATNSPSRSAACITASSTARQARSLIWSVLIDQIGLVASRAWSFLGAFRIVYNSGMIGIRQCGCPRDHVWRETLA
jgi:hypothetical protein